MVNFPRLTPGTQLQVGSHEVTIVQYLSEGGFAHIYSVTTRATARPDADPVVACLKRVVVPDRQGLDQLRVEVDVMKKLAGSDKIVQYFDSHAQRLAGGPEYEVLLLMELCPNGSLLDYMNTKLKTKLTEPEILKIMFDVTLGAREMHKLRLIHRDIKIENVLINSANTFKLCDFGSTSGVIEPPVTPEQFQRLQGDLVQHTTPQYRSPEMVDLRRGAPIDEKSDIWALGVFLYKLCYYTTPFESVGEIAILHAAYSFPSKPVYSNDLKNLVVIMLQEDPQLRPNVNQILYILLKMSGNTSYRFNDFYGLGEYDFVRLQEYQQRKQEVMRQSQRSNQSLEQYPEQQNQEQEIYQQGQSLKSSTQLVQDQASTPQKQAMPSQKQAQDYPSSPLEVRSPSEVKNSSQLSSADPTSAHTTRPNSTAFSDEDSEAMSLEDIEARFPSLEKIQSKHHSISPRPASMYIQGISVQTSTSSEELKAETVLQQRIASYGGISRSPSMTRNPEKSHFLSKEDAWERGRDVSVNPEADRLVESIFGGEKEETSAMPMAADRGNAQEAIPVESNWGKTKEQVSNPKNGDVLKSESGHSRKTEISDASWRANSSFSEETQNQSNTRTASDALKRKSFNPFPATEVYVPPVPIPGFKQPPLPMEASSPRVLPSMSSENPWGNQFSAPGAGYMVPVSRIPSIPRDLIDFEDAKPVITVSEAVPSGATLIKPDLPPRQQSKHLLDFDLVELEELSFQDNEDPNKLQRIRSMNLQEEVVDFSSEDSANELKVPHGGERKGRYSFKSKKQLRSGSNHRTSSTSRTHRNSVPEDDDDARSVSSWFQGDEQVTAELETGLTEALSRKTSGVAKNLS